MSKYNLLQEFLLIKVPFVKYLLYLLHGRYLLNTVQFLSILRKTEILLVCVFIQMIENV